MEIETFNITVKILKLDILSELEVYVMETKYEIHLGGILISTLEHISERPEPWYQVNGRLPKGDVKVIGDAIDMFLA